MDLKKQEENFKYHKATFTDYGNIKILDFKNPESSQYRIRFLFEEDYCRLHISGDLGELIATNYNNMTYEKFSDFVDNIGYFKEKIDCHNRAIYRYDEEKARKDIKEYMEEFGVEKDDFSDGFLLYDTDDEAIDDILEDFDDERGMGSKGYDVFSHGFSDAWEFAGDIGKESTGILDLYMLAFKLATKKLN